MDEPVIGVRPRRWDAGLTDLAVSRRSKQEEREELDLDCRNLQTRGVGPEQVRHPTLLFKEDQGPSARPRPREPADRSAFLTFAVIIPALTSRASNSGFRYLGHDNDSRQDGPLSSGFLHVTFRATWVLPQSRYCWRIRLRRRGPRNTPLQDTTILPRLRPIDRRGEFASSIRSFLIDRRQRS
jgi:hypothetical protein